MTTLLDAALSAKLSAFGTAVGNCLRDLVMPRMLPDGGSVGQLARMGSSGPEWVASSDPSIGLPPPNPNMLDCPTFRVNHRATSAVTTNLSYIVDRWRYLASGSGTLSLSASSFAPPGCIGSLRIETTATAAPSTNQRNNVTQSLEGFDLDGLRYGSSDAEPVCLSFWVYSSRVGAFSCSFLQSGSTLYSYVKPWAVNAANTWERKTLVVPGHVAAALVGGTDTALFVRFCLGARGTSAADAGVAETWATGNLWGASAQVCMTDTLGSLMYISSPKLERGTFATLHELPEYRDELREARRYLRPISGSSNPGRTLRTCYPLGEPMRATPTLTLLSGSTSGADYAAVDASTIVSPSTTAASASSDWVLLASAEI